MAPARRFHHMPEPRPSIRCKRPAPPAARARVPCGEFSSTAVLRMIAYGSEYEGLFCRSRGGSRGGRPSSSSSQSSPSVTVSALIRSRSCCRERPARPPITSTVLSAYTTTACTGAWSNSRKKMPPAVTWLGLGLGLGLGFGLGVRARIRARVRLTGEQYDQ